MLSGEEELVAFLDEILTPYVAALAKVAVGEIINTDEVTFNAIVEVIYAKLEITVREAVRQINRDLRAKRYANVRRLVREHPRIAKRAAEYVSKKLKHKLRQIIKEELMKLAEESEAKNVRPKTPRRNHNAT